MNVANTEKSENDDKDNENDENNDDEVKPITKKTGFSKSCFWYLKYNISFKEIELYLEIDAVLIQEECQKKMADAKTKTQMKIDKI